MFAVFVFDIDVSQALDGNKICYLNMFSQYLSKLHAFCMAAMLGEPLLHHRTYLNPDALYDALGTS